MSAILVGGWLAAGATPAYASAFPGDNGVLTLTRGPAQSTHIYSVNPDGTGERDLTPTSGEIYNRASSVSPDGSRAVFLSNRAVGCTWCGEIYVVNLDGTGTRRLTTTTVDSQFPDHPTWSPDGTRIAYFRANQIWTMNADGSAQAPLTSDPTVHDYPSWSPDGLLIAFARWGQPGDAGGRIYVMNADGTGAYPVSGNGGSDSGNLSWSPDGTRIAFTTARNGGGEIWVAAADGSGEDGDALVKCCRGPAVPAPGGANPAWSPDGLQLAFESNGLATDPEYPKHSIFVIGADGDLASLTRLTHGAGDTYVSWGPAAGPPVP